MDKINDTRIVPGPMKEVHLFGMERKPSPRTRNPRRGKSSMRSSIDVI